MQLRDRLRYWWSAFAPLGRLLAIVWTLLGGLTLLRDFLPPSAQLKLTGFAGLAYLPHWSAAGWAASGLLILLVASLEGSYRLQRIQTLALAAIAETRPQLRLVPITRPERAAVSLYSIGTGLGLRITNEGQAARFAATVQLLSEGAQPLQQPSGRHALAWERGGGTQTDLMTGEEDSVWLGTVECNRRDERPTGLRVRHHDEMTHTSEDTWAGILAQGAASDSQFFVVLEVCIVSDPPMLGGPLTTRWQFGPRDLVQLPSQPNTP